MIAVKTGLSLLVTLNIDSFRVAMTAAVLAYHQEQAGVTAKLAIAAFTYSLRSATTFVPLDMI